MSEANTQTDAIHHSIPTYVKEFVRQIAIDLGFNNDLTVDFATGSSVGDGFMGSLTAVTVADSLRSPMHLMCKMLPADPATTNELNVKQFFKREVLIYDKILPIFEQFQRSKGLDHTNGFFSYPKCYGSICDEVNDRYVIVMDDLRIENYCMWTKRKLVDIEHARMVFSQLARLHAISLALHDQQPDAFAPVRAAGDLFHKLLDIPSFKVYMDQTITKMLQVLEESHPNHVTSIRAICDTMLASLGDQFDGHKLEPLAVLAHGDCWGNNTMFKYVSTN